MGVTIVDVTFSLAFEKVVATNPAAAELLCACSFLAPNDIPEYIFMQIGLDWGDILGPVTVNEIEWDLALQTARNLSLLRREAQTELLSIHRLVQEVVKSNLDDTGKRRWAERAVCAVDKAMPAVGYENWPIYDTLLPHARNCAEMITLYQIDVVAAGRLLNQTAYHLDQRSQFEEAGKFYIEAFLFADAHLSDDNPNKAVSYNNLGKLYATRDEDSKAEPLYQRAYDLLSRLPELSHHSIVNVLNNLGELHGRRGRYDQAKVMLDKALTYQTKNGNIDTSLTAAVLNNLANVHAQHRQYKHAQSLLLKARQIQNKVLLPEDPYNAVVLNSLAVTYSAQGKFREAEEAYQQAITILSVLQGEQHPDLPPLLRNYARFLRARGKELEATTLESKYRNSLEN